MNRRLLIPIAGLGLALLVIPFWRGGSLLPPNARCLACGRTFYAPLGPVYDARCKYAMDGQMAREQFNQPRRQMFLSIYPIKGPVPSSLTVIK